MKRLIFTVILFSLPLFEGALFAQSITLDETLRSAAQSNLDVARERVTKDASKLGYEVAKGAFIPIVSVDTAYQDNTDFLVGRNRFVRSNAGLFWLTPYGTELGLAAQATYVESGSGGLPLTRIGFDVTQPLLSGAWGAGQDLDALSLDEKIQTALFIANLNDILFEVETTYWNLVLAQFDVEITKRSVDRAKQQFEDTEANIKQGILAPGELFVVEENYVFFEQQLLRAIERKKTTAARLATLLRSDTYELVASQDPLTYVGEVPPEPALEDHPRVVAQSARERQADSRLQREKANRLPSLDLRGGVALNGISGPTSEAWGETFGGDFASFEVGLLFSTPLWYSASNAEVEQRELALRRSQIDKEQLLRELEESRKTIREQLETRRKVLQLAERRFELSGKKLENENDKYKNGVSRLPEVVRFQRDLDSAELAVVRARIDVILLTSQLVAELALRHDQIGVEVK